MCIRDSPEYNGPMAYAVSNFEGYDEYHEGVTDEIEGIKVIDEKTISFTFKDGRAAPANIECFDYGIMLSLIHILNVRYVVLLFAASLPINFPSFS